MKKILLLFLIFSKFLFAQKPENNSISLSFFIGGLSIQSDNFTKIYKSNTGLIFGSSLGIPVNDRFTLEGSVLYHQKESKYISALDGGTPANAIVKQVVAFGGFRYIIYSKSFFELGLCGGLSLAVLDEERVADDDKFLFAVEGLGNFGIYGGMNAEINLWKSHFAIYTNLKYLFSWAPVMKFDDTYRALFFVGGIKIYLTDRW